MTEVTGKRKQKQKQKNGKRIAEKKIGTEAKTRKPEEKEKTGGKVSKLGMKNLSKGIKVEVQGNVVRADVALNICFGYAIPEVSAKVQERVKSAIENMTGLEVSSVNIRIAGVNTEKHK